MESIVSQIYALVESADNVSRLSIQRELQKVQSEIQGPHDTLMAFGNSNLLIAMLRLAVDLRVFRQLVKSQHPLTVANLAKPSNSCLEFMERVLRYLAANLMIQETGVNEYRANNVTYVLADPRGEGIAYHGFDVFGPVIQVMPNFFAENKYQDITSNINTPFQKAFNTQLTCFEWLVQNPKHFESLQKVMTALEGVEWTNGFSLLEEEETFFVDVGGGHGHQGIQLGKKYPALLGHLVLQDLPETINRLPPIEGVKAQAADFFQVQPIIGANFYYLRRIIHDWPDKEAVVILQNIASAMTPKSRILVDDVVLPDTGAHWQAAMADLSMMFCFGGKERTTRQWNLLADRAGLRIEQFHTYAATHILRSL
ncbi:Winged helix-turn-helix transcription repressor DNA-binding [Penicillium chermesinum]|nr:Winged helix-turn-helix transcription repressor DNA-binding [Penicillium chermesinum]